MAPRDRGPTIDGITLFFVVTCGLVTILRVYTRAILMKHFGMDDWFAVISYVGIARNISDMRD
jgi:hypothetical protein